MKLSIITINKNNKDGLQRTIASVQSQTYRDFEYVVVDGASNDGSVEIIKNVRMEANGYRWLSEKDSGVFEAMNKGIKMAHGDYLLFLNSGDYLVNGTVLESIFSQEYQESILSGICRVSNGGKVVWMSKPQEHYTLGYFYHNSMAHQATFIRKSLFEKYGLYREDLRLMGDWEWFLRVIVLNNENVKALNVEVSDYNMEGMSSLEKNRALIECEKRQVYADLHLQNVVEDYRHADELLHKEEEMRWGWQKWYLRGMVKVLYKMKKKLYK